MGDPLQYHRWALKLAHRYHHPGGVHSRDDLYQIAMVGLLELWRDKPEAEEPLCVYAMKAAVVREIRAAMAQKRTAVTVPLEEVRTAAGPDDPASTAVGHIQAEWLLEVVEELPDREFALLQLSMMGTNMRAYCRENGLKRPAVQAAINQARAHVRRRMEASA